MESCIWLLLDNERLELDWGNMLSSSGRLYWPKSKRNTFLHRRHERHPPSYKTTIDRHNYCYICGTTSHTYVFTSDKSVTPHNVIKCQSRWHHVLSLRVRSTDVATFDYVGHIRRTLRVTSFIGIPANTKLTESRWLSAVVFKRRRVCCVHSLHVGHWMRPRLR